MSTDAKPKGTGSYASKKARAICEAWNKANPIGTVVNYMPRGAITPTVHRTCGEAYAYAGTRPMVPLEGRDYPANLCRIKVRASSPAV